MKNLFIIGGTMGVGKTAVSQQLKSDLPNSVFLDGDWCWDANPFHVTTETKAMVTDNITDVIDTMQHIHIDKVIKRKRRKILYSSH